MHYRDASIMSERLESATLDIAEGANRRRLCRRFGVRPKVHYKWFHRFQKCGVQALEDSSRRPNSSPKRTAHNIEQPILAIRDGHSAWGPKHIRARLEGQGMVGLPSVSTIIAIL